MSDPTIKRAHVTIKYTGSDDYRVESNYGIALQLPPQTPLLKAFEELSRLLHLFGHGDEAMKLANDAAVRVQEWRDQRGAQ